MQVCFIGHRTIDNKEEVKQSLEKTIVALLGKGVNIFLFGSNSAFDELSLKVVTSLKSKYPFIKRVYVRSTFQHIDASYEQYLLELYDETYFPAKIEKAGKYSYVERNYELIDRSSYCVFYFNQDYVKYLAKNNKSSGTKRAYDYAVKKNKNIINLYN